MLPLKIGFLGSAMARQWLPPRALRQYQLLHLRRVVGAAYDKSPLYREKFRKAGVTPADLHRVEDIALFPLLERREIIDSYPDGVITRPLRDSDVIYHTSGSSGRFMNIPYDEAGADFLDAIYARALFGVGYKPWDRIAYFWWTADKKAKPYERIGLMKKTILESDADPHKQLEMLCRVDPAVIYNFPTSMANVAKLIEHGRPRELNPRLIICHGEFMADESVRYISRAFGCPVFNQYGAQEFNRMAWDCPRQEGLHQDSDSVLIEFVRDGQPAMPGEEGELVITSLHNTLMPLIRYRIGDLGKSVDRRCSCGRGLPLIELTGGRMDDHIVLPSGATVGPRAIVPRIERFHGFKQFRVVQNSVDQVDVLLVKEPDCPANTDRDLETELRKVLGGEIRIQCQSVDEIPLRGRGKLRCIERDKSVRLPTA